MFIHIQSFNFSNWSQKLSSKWHDWRMDIIMDQDDSEKYDFSKY